MAIHDRLLAALLLLPVAACTSVEHQEPMPSSAAPGTAAIAKPDRTAHGITIHEPAGNLPVECAARRKALAAALGASGPGVVWVEAVDGAKLEDRFFQEDNFWYLSGVEISDVALAIVVDASGAVSDEVLFVPPHDADYEVWNGSRLSPGPAAEAATGFRHTARRTTRNPDGSIKEAGDEEALLAGWAPTKIWTTGPVRMELPTGATIDSAQTNKALAALRLRKSAYEIACLKAAIDITCAALHDAAAEVKPGAWECEPWGALEGAFLKLGSERPGFPSIFGSGPNSVTLHYDSNRRQMQAGELIVMDVGCKYRYYCADVTRTVPVSGSFTPRQREVYDLVLEAQTAAFEAAKPGVTMSQLDAIARRVIDAGGFGPGRRYFKHGLGHWIGLNVHDVGGSVPIEPGMLFTIEPGIYIAEENLGVRIEDDYLMTESGAIKLSDGIPSDPDAIEALLRR